jgi:hypothetical protein
LPGFLLEGDAPLDAKKITAASPCYSFIGARTVIAGYIHQFDLFDGSAYIDICLIDCYRHAFAAAGIPAVPACQHTTDALAGKFLVI